MHTKGPWTVGGTSNPKAVGPIVNTLQPGGTTIYPVCVVCGDTDETKYNARLIAAAPELLEAIKTIAANLEPSGRPRAYFGLSATIADSINRARAAIAKATVWEVTPDNTLGEASLEIGGIPEEIETPAPVDSYDLPGIGTVPSMHGFTTCTHPECQRGDGKKRSIIPLPCRFGHVKES
jgi:hypothetical protein